MNYLIGDFLIRIKNGYLAYQKKVDLPYSKFAESVGEVLVKEGYLKTITKNVTDGKPALVAELLYTGRKRAMSDVKIISKPSLHKYLSKNQVKKTLHDFGISVLSASEGVMSNKKAHEKNLGGEIICKIV